MKIRLTLLLLLATLLAPKAAGETRYVGGDISLLPEYEQAGASYKDHDGKPIAELLPWLREQGMNIMRVRLFVNPDDYNRSDKDPNACQDLDYIIPLCQRIKAAGFALMLDFHYSDTWADPVKQWTPKAWENLDDKALATTLHDYTKNVLETLKEKGATPDFIQPGNEISYGMLWGKAGSADALGKKCLMGVDANWSRFGDLLKSAIKACRAVCPDAKIILHTERVAQPEVQNNFYNKMKEMGVDYDIIGLSYYPYFHGGLTVLDTALYKLEGLNLGKNIMIVETGYSYKWEVPGTDHDMTNIWPYSDAGQNKFASDLVATLLKHPAVDGLVWWWMEYNAKDTDLSAWYNAPLFDSTTGCATSALKTICSFASESGVDDILAAPADADDRWYNIDGTPATDITRPGLYVSRNRKIIVR